MGAGVWGGNRNRSQGSLWQSPRVLPDVLASVARRKELLSWRRMKKLPRDFYDRDTVLVARELLGKSLVHIMNGERRIGKIVEVEAYLGPHDLAAHSARGRTRRNEAMFGPPGHAYVYMIYGMYYCINVVTEPEGHAAAVLLRALEPMQNVTDKTSGPGLLCRAMNIDRRLNGHDLLSNDFFIAAPDTAEKFTIVKRPRIGVDYARHWAKRHLRFYVKGNPFVSKR
jgi:DNA-3-methyladenine glycosylase